MPLNMRHLQRSAVGLFWTRRRPIGASPSTGRMSSLRTSSGHGRDSPMPRRSPEGTHSSCTWGCSDWPTSCPKEAYGTPLEVPHVQRHIGASAVKRVSIDEIVAQRYAHVVKGSPGGGLMLTDEGRKHLVSFPPFGRIVLTCPHTVR